MSVAHNARASAWSVPARLAIRRIDGTDTPSACDASIPTRAMPGRRVGSAAASNAATASSYVTRTVAIPAG